LAATPQAARSRSKCSGSFARGEVFALLAMIDSEAPESQLGERMASASRSRLPRQRRRLGRSRRFLLIAPAMPDKPRPFLEAHHRALTKYKPRPYPIGSR